MTGHVESQVKVRAIEWVDPDHTSDAVSTDLFGFSIINREHCLNDPFVATNPRNITNNVPEDFKAAAINEGRVARN